MMTAEHRSFSTLFFRFPRVAVLAIITLCIASILSFDLLGRQEDPSLSRRFGRIVTLMPGADAETIEALVTKKIEDRLLEISELDDIRSTSRSGVSMILIGVDEKFGPKVVDEVWTEVNQKVNQARSSLPAAASEPEILRAYLGASTIIVSVTPKDEESLPLSVIARLAESLADQLQRIPGTEETDVFGKIEEEITVELNMEKVSALGLSPLNIRDKLLATDVKIPAGQISDREVRLQVKMSGEFESQHQLGEVVIDEQPRGRFVKLKEVSSIKFGEREPLSQYANLNGVRGIAVAAYLTPNQRIDKWNKVATETVEKFAESTGDSLNVEIIFAQDEYASSRLSGLVGTLIYSVILIIAVLFLMMGWRSAIVIGSVLPLTLATVILLFRWIDTPLHQMSVSGLIVALGLLIDNAIIVVDEYRLFRRKTENALQAIHKTVSHLFLPLGASTLTTVLAFMPIILLPGSAGEFVGMVGISVIFAICSSYFLSMTIIPSFAAWIKVGTAEQESQQRFWQKGFTHPWLTQAYGTTIEWVLRRPLLGLIIAFILPIIGGITYISAPYQFFPQTDRDMFALDLTLDPSSSIHKTIEVTNQIEGRLKQYEGVEEVYWFSGESAPRVYYNVFNFQDNNSAFAAGFVRTKNRSITRKIIGVIQADLRQEFPHAQILAMPFEQGPPVDAPIVLEVYGESLKKLEEIGQKLRPIIMKEANAVYSFSSIKLGTPTIAIEPNQGQLELLNQSNVMLSQNLAARSQGIEAGSIIKGAETIPVILKQEKQEVDQVSALRNSSLVTRTAGQGVAIMPLSSVATLTLEPQTSAITRSSGQRVNNIYGFLPPYALPDAANGAVMKALAETDLQLPPGYEIKVAGEQEESDAALANLRAVAIPLLVAMVVCIVFAFNSFRYGLIVVASAALSFGLALFGVWMFAVPFGFMAILGAMGLLGLALNDTIVVLSALKADGKAVNGDIGSARDTIIDATRHIIATTLTTIGGFTPLLIQGDAFWLPLAAAIAGGVAGACLLALYFVPACFALFVMRKKDQLRPLSLTKRIWTTMAFHPSKA